MASAWGKSWGKSFGVAFGAVVMATATLPMPEMGGGGTAYTEDLWTHKNQQEDEIIILAVAQLIVNGAFV